MSDNKGLLFVFGEPGPNAPEEEWNDWYDNEHVPLRQTVEGFKSWLRYKAIDSKKPGWVALYDLTNPEVISSEAYQAINLKASAREKELVSRTKLLNRRVYELVQCTEKANFSTSDVPSKYLFTVEVECKPEDEEDLNKWYEEEHFPLIEKVPGWVRGRRYKLVSGRELAGQADQDALPPTKYLSVHEWDRPNFKEQQEFADMYKHPWSERVFKYVTRRDPRLFELHKDFAASK